MFGATETEAQMRIATAFLVVLTAASLAAPASAAKRKKGPVSEPPAVAARGPVCTPLCTADTTPCDPPEFKRADGRCNLNTPANPAL
jgi:hypothetical protein